MWNKQDFQSEQLSMKEGANQVANDKKILKISF